MSKRLLSTCMMVFMMAVCMSAYALEKVNGVYQIGTAEDYFAFAELVNGGEKDANAILTADIDLGTNNTKIGKNNSGYLGTFDGAGHTITINFSEGADGEGPALFHSIDQRAIITRLKVQGTLTAAKYKHSAAIANYSSGVIRNCFTDIVVNANFADNADASIGGVVGQLNKCALVENCLSKIKVLGSTTHKCGGLAAWVDTQRVCIANCLVINDEESNFNWADGKSAGLVRDGDNLLEVLNLESYNEDSYRNRPSGASANNYVTNDWGKLGKAATVISSADVASGKACFLLNSDQSQIRWVQRIGIDPYPVPAVFGTGRVYASAPTNCQGQAEGEVTYSNTPSNAVATAHTCDKYGVCTTCGQFNWNGFDFDNPERFDIADKSFLISDGSDLFLAESWNRFQNGCKFNLKLTNDVECKPEPGQLIFNTNDWIESNFNGQGHTLTIEMVDINEQNAALFPKPYAYRGDYVFENVVMHGKISSIYTNKGMVGSIAAREYGNGANKMIYRNVYSDVEVNVATPGDNTSAGLLAVADRTTVFENCIYAGNVNCVEGGDGVAGIVGWANGSTTTLTNCAFVGTLNNAGSGSTELVRNYNSNQTYNNVYSLNSYGDEGENAKFTLLESADCVENGELAYLLNGKQEGVERFYQNIGEDKCPSPIAKEGALVYTDQYKCDGQPLTFSNTPRSSDPVIPDHQCDADGICTICGELEKDADGYMKIINARALAQFSKLLNSGKTAINARLYDDIDMSDTEYVAAGSATSGYTGEFDGQFHTISNLIIDNDKNYQGLFSLVADGAVIKNFVLDESCSISGNAFCGVIGGTVNANGTIYITNVGNEGSVTTANQNAAGIIGVDQGGLTDMFITNCWVTGAVNGGRESGAICGYSSDKSQVTNCWSTAFMPQTAIYSSDSFTRGNAQVINCYEADIEGVDANKQQHNKPLAENRRTNLLTSEEVLSGALCFNLNGKQFRNPAWYQTIGEDEKPSPNPTQGIVIGGAEQYFSVTSDDDIPNVASVIGSYEEEQASSDSIATQALLDEWKAAAEVLSKAETILALADAYDSLNVVKAAVKENMAIYQAYIDKCAEVSKFLEEDNTFSGSLRTALENYLSEEGEPDEDNPLGTYDYIIENHTATGEEIQAEIVRVDEWLKLAIAEDYVPGTDISWLIPNSDFAKKNAESWTGAWCNAFGDVKVGEGKEIVGVEGWNRTGDMYQTVENMKPGYYLVGLSGAFRPSNNRYSTNYVAGVYANGIFNYFPTVIEDYVAVANAIDQENCNLHGQGALDVPIYSDFASTDDDQASQAHASLLGYAVQGPYGMAIAASAGRYQAYTIAYVGEDGKLTIGIKSQGTKYAEDWTGWGPIKVTYCGEEADEALGTVLENMKARAESIINYELGTDIKSPYANPNFPAELKAALVKAVDAIDTAETVDAKAELVKQFSDLFQAVYDGKSAYADLYNLAFRIEAIDGGNLPLVEKDNVGEWFETGERVFGDDFFDASQEMLNAFSKGSFSTEEALNPATALSAKQAEAITTIIPEQDEEGYYLISNPKQFVAYRSLFLNGDQSIKAKLVEDIDMTGIGMQPFGNNTVGNDDKGINYKGTLDGQGHALENVYINYMGGRGCALFYELDNATVKNLKLTGEYYGDMQRMGGLTRYTSGATKIENCEIAVVLHNDITGDATSGGITGCSRGGGNVMVTNCIVNCKIIAKKATSFGGVCGWRDGNLTLTNVLILSQYDTAPEPSSYPADVLSRNGCTVNNVYYAERSLVPGATARGTEATDSQLASGEICYKLNGGNLGENAVWFQTIGEDANPVLDKTHKLVVYDEVLGYHNMTQDEEDAIDDITPGFSVGDGAIYNLAGQRVSKPQKGIFILNGKKVMFR